MRPTLRQLQYFVAVADTGRFGEAANRMNVSQPSLSAQIAEMEGQLGTILFERGRQGALLTPKGEALLGRCRQILRDVEDLKAIASHDRGDLAGRIRLGILPTIGPYLLPLATRQLHRKYPDLRLFVREERTIDLEQHLHDGRFDAIISTPEDHTNVAHMPLFEEQLWICAAADDELARTADPISLKELKDRPLLSLGHGHRLNLTIQTIARAAGSFVSAEYEGTSLDAVRQMAEMGAGIAILPSLYALTEARRDPDLVIRPIHHSLATRGISLIWRDSSPLADSLTILGEEFRQVAGNVL
ncbi:MAG: hydrogen peroxide-inducible genes activator [Henriciella sp.]|nr:hydrogen peroxide-inducible genes activator [Henriciella sp.]